MAAASYKFEVWSDDCGVPSDEALDFMAWNADDAAEKFADDYDVSTAEYNIVAQRLEPVVFVRDLRDGGVMKFKVTGEARPHYTATEVG